MSWECKRKKCISRWSEWFNYWKVKKRIENWLMGYINEYVIGDAGQRNLWSGGGKSSLKSEVNCVFSGHKSPVSPSYRTCKWPFGQLAFYYCSSPRPSNVHVYILPCLLQYSCQDHHQIGESSSFTIAVSMTSGMSLNLFGFWYSYQYLP